MFLRLQIVFFLIYFASIASTEVDSSRKLCVRGKEHNRKLVLEFYQKAYGDLEFDEAAKYLFSDYIEHDPDAGDGIPAFVEGSKKLFKGGSKTRRVDIRRSASDGTLVWVHARLNIPSLGKPYVVFVDIYRVECSKIMEHWDVYQEIGQGPYANPHPYF